MHTPAKMVMTQNTQRHSTPATFMKPLTVGPRAGPAKGARVKNPSAFPRVLASHISEIRALEICKHSTEMLEPTRTYPLITRGAAANVPPRNRKIRIAPVLGDNAQPTWNPV